MIPIMGQKPRFNRFTRRGFFGGTLGLALILLSLIAHWGCQGKVSPTSPTIPAKGFSLAFTIPVTKDLKASLLGVANNEVYYNVTGPNMAAVTGVAGPFSTAADSGEVDFSISVPQGSARLMSFQLNNAANHQPLALGAVQSDISSGVSDIWVTMGSVIRNCYVVDSSSYGVSTAGVTTSYFTFQSDTLSATPTGSPDLSIETVGTGTYALSALASDGIAYLGNGQLVGFDSIPATFLSSSNVSKQAAGASPTYLQAGDVYCISLGTGAANGHAWIQIVNPNQPFGLIPPGPTGPLLLYRVNTSLPYYAYDPTNADNQGSCPAPPPTPTNVPTNTFTPTITPTVTNTLTSTLSPTDTDTPFVPTSTFTFSPTFTPTLTWTASSTDSFTATSTLISTATSTNTPTGTPTNTATNSFTPTITFTLTNTITGTVPPSNTTTPTATNTATLTSTITASPTITPTPGGPFIIKGTVTYNGTKSTAGMNILVYASTCLVCGNNNNNSAIGQESAASAVPSGSYAVTMPGPGNYLLSAFLTANSSFHNSGPNAGDSYMVYNSTSNTSLFGAATTIALTGTTTINLSFTDSYLIQGVTGTISYTGPGEVNAENPLFITAYADSGYTIPLTNGRGVTVNNSAYNQAIPTTLTQAYLQAYYAESPGNSGAITTCDPVTDLGAVSLNPVATQGITLNGTNRYGSCGNILSGTVTYAVAGAVVNASNPIIVRAWSAPSGYGSFIGDFAATQNGGSYSLGMPAAGNYYVTEEYVTSPGGGWTPQNYAVGSFVEDSDGTCSVSNNGFGTPIAVSGSAVTDLVFNNQCQQIQGFTGTLTYTGALTSNGNLYVQAVTVTGEDSEQSQTSGVGLNGGIYSLALGSQGGAFNASYPYSGQYYLRVWYDPNGNGCNGGCSPQNGDSWGVFGPYSPNTGTPINLTFSGGSPWELGTPVTFADSNLEFAVREVLGITSTQIFTTDMANLSSLDVEADNIASLVGLETAVNLTSLILDGNQITDLTPLAGLTQINTLELDGNQITDLTPLSNLTFLNALSLDDNPISNLQPLQNLTQLFSLELDGDQITTLGTALSNMGQLSVLDLGNNSGLSDISSLASNTNLQGLYLGFDSIVDLTPLQYLTHLTYVELEQNQITDLTALVNNTGFGAGSTIYLTGNPLSTTATTSQIPTLQGMGVNVITGINPPTPTVTPTPLTYIISGSVTYAGSLTSVTTGHPIELVCSTSPDFLAGTFTAASVNVNGGNFSFPVSATGIYYLLSMVGTANTPPCQLSLLTQGSVFQYYGICNVPTAIEVQGGSPAALNLSFGDTCGRETGVSGGITYTGSLATVSATHNLIVRAYSDPGYSNPIGPMNRVTCNNTTYSLIIGQPTAGFLQAFVDLNNDGNLDPGDPYINLGAFLSSVTATMPVSFGDSNLKGALPTATSTLTPGSPTPTPTTTSTPAPNLIDDFESGTNLLTLNQGRNGYFYTNANGSSTIVPLPFTVTSPGDVSNYAAAVFGTTDATAGDSAYLGANFLSTGAGYAISNSYTGIVFDIEGTVPGSTLWFEVGDTTTNTSSSGYDEDGAMVPVTSSWTPVTVFFTQMDTRGFGIQMGTHPLDVAQAVGFSWLVTAPSANYNFEVDNVQFTTATGPTPTPTPTPNPLLIANMENDTNQLPPNGGRSGYWGSYSDGSSTLVPAVGSTFAMSSPGYQSNYAAQISGVLADISGAYVGMSSNFVSTGGAYNIPSSITGVVFEAKAAFTGACASPLVEFFISDATTNPSSDTNHVNVPVGPNWQAVTVFFNQMMTSGRSGGVTQTHLLDTTTAMAMSWQINTSNQNIGYDLWVDNVQFITATPPTAAVPPSWSSALIDNFEQGDTQMILQGGRNGYWYVNADANSTVCPLPGGNYVPSPAGDSVSPLYAAQLFGTVATGGFAQLGTNFTSPQAAYNAGSYTGFTFYAKAGSGSTTTLTFGADDEYTIPSADICGVSYSCYLNKGTVETLTNNWVQYTVPFTSMVDAADTAQPVLDPTQLYDMNFSMNSPGAFDLWVDDVSFY
jgi:Leucine-rich repeat (LRR) protein